MLFNTKNISIVIQGIHNENALKMIHQYNSKFKEIIYSTYETSDVDFIKKIDFKNVKVIYNQIDPKKGYNVSNLYFQVNTTLNGLINCNSEYVIKLRSDEYYSNLDKISFSNHCITSNGFIRNWSYSKFHFSDHLIFINKKKFINSLECLKLYLESSFDNLNLKDFKTPPETIIFLFIYFNLSGQCCFDWRKSDIYTFKEVKPYFKIIDVSNLSPYIIKSSVSGNIYDLKQFISKDTVQNLIYYNHIDDMSEKKILIQLIYRFIFKVRALLY